jgi:hypothetical protein
MPTSPSAVAAEIVEEDEADAPVVRELEAKGLHRATTRSTGSHTHAMCTPPTKSKNMSQGLGEHVEFDVRLLSSMVGAPSDKPACSKAIEATKCLPTSDDVEDRGEELDELAGASAVCMLATPCSSRSMSPDGSRKVLSTLIDTLLVMRSATFDDPAVFIKENFRLVNTSCTQKKRVCTCFMAAPAPSRKH